MGIQLRQTQFASYNGYVFNQTVHTKRISITPEPTGDGRSIKWNRWRFTLSVEIATNIGTTDPAVKAATTALSHAGGVFIYRGRGLGNPDINTGTVRDLQYGPVPKVIDVQVIGTGNAVLLTWSVEFTVSNCPGANNPFGFLELSYRVSHTKDDAGFTTRRVSGYLVIPNNRKSPGDTKVEVSADAYRDRLLTPIPFGFQRKGYTFDESADLTRLDFSWQDEEQPVPLPPGVVEATFTDDVASTARGLVMWQGTMSGTYRMARGYNWLVAAQAFFEMAAVVLADRKDRLGAMKKAKPGVKPAVLFGQGKTDKPALSTPIPTAFRMSNPNRYGKPQAQFSLSYTFACPLSQLVAATGLYLPFTHSYKVWLASMEDVNNPYGGADLTWLPQDDPGIVDACNIPGELRAGGGWNPPPLGGGGTAKSGNYFPSFPKNEAPIDRQVSELVRGTFEKPSQEDSWITYDCSIFLEAVTGILRVKQLATTKPDPTQSVFGTDGLVTPSGAADALTDFKKMAPPWFVPNVGGNLVNIPVEKGIQRRTQESCVVYLTGKAYRAGFPVNPPRLLAINGIPCTPQCRPDRGEGFGQGVWCNGVESINYGYWNLRYVLDSVPPGPLPIPTNPQSKS